RPRSSLREIQALASDNNGRQVELFAFNFAVQSRLGAFVSNRFQRSHAVHSIQGRCQPFFILSLVNRLLVDLFNLLLESLYLLLSNFIIEPPRSPSSTARAKHIGDKK